MAKGKKTGGGSRKGKPNKATADVRASIAQLLEHAAPLMVTWLDRVALTDPAKALDIVGRMTEYHIPKLQRTEIGGLGGRPIQVQAIENDDRI